jgi:cardiolipin synthase A/B
MTVYAEVAVGPNRVALLKDGTQAFPAMCEAIAAAKHTICLETYILRDDATGSHFIELLSERAQSGVLVLLMYDFWGSQVSEVTVRAMAAAGITQLAFRPWRPAGGSLARALVRLSRRNHRKTLVVDGRVGFTGGLNLSDDYAAKAEGGSEWRDTHVRIAGPDAAALERMFLKTWTTHRGPKVDAARFKRPAVAGCEQLRIVGNDFALDRKGIRRAYEAAFSAARDRIFITNAYFLPPAKMVRALVAAARAQVRVAIILAGTTDVKLVLYAARGLYAKLLRAGIEVYEWTDERVLHAKTAVVDGRWATVGSSNLDPLSLRNNLECNAVITEPQFAQAMERLFLEDLAHCERVMPQHLARFGWWSRLASWLALKVRHWL